MGLESMGDKNMLNFTDRVRGVLFGTAFGDAMGATIEKLSYEQIKEKYGRVQSIMTKWHKEDLDAFARKNRNRGYGIVTDDTLMTLALINIYAKEKRPLDAWDMAYGMSKEITTNKIYIPEFGREDFIIERLFYPDKWIYQRHNLANCEPREGGIGNMINCGAAMYIAPIGVVNACDPYSAYNEAIDFASGHQASYGLEAAGVLAACVAKAFEPNVSVQNVVDTALSLAKDGTRYAIEDLCEVALKIKDKKDNKDFVVKEFQKTILPYSPMGDDINRRFVERESRSSNYYIPSRNFSIEELPFALAYALLHDGDFRETIIDGINSGRDTDSIGVMVGVILGAMQGDSQITDDEKKTLIEVNKMDFYQISLDFSNTAKTLIEKKLKDSEKRKQNLSKILA